MKSGRIIDGIIGYSLLRVDLHEIDERPDDACKVNIGHDSSAWFVEYLPEPGASVDARAAMIWTAAQGDEGATDGAGIPNDNDGRRRRTGSKEIISERSLSAIKHGDGSQVEDYIAVRLLPSLR